jgi:glycosyltransferase involved in cell wall biosynthesis
VKLRRLADDRVSFEGPIAFDRVPETIAECDVYALPQLDGPASIGQVPMKMIDAMALGRAIVGTQVGDIPWWLADGAGLVVPPNDAASLAAGIERLLDDASQRSRLGQLARRQFLSFGSFTAVRNRLLPWVADLINGRKLKAPLPAFAEDYRHAEIEPEECVGSYSGAVA